jgi:hypothetical protein
MALTPLPKPRGGQGYSYTRTAFGSGGDVSFAAPGLMEFLKQAEQALPQFNTEMRKAAQRVAEVVVFRAKKNANAQPPHGKNPGTRSQAAAVVLGLKARRDRIPTIKLDGNKLYPSKTRSNRKRGRGQLGPGLAGVARGFDRKVTMGDVFYGAEFGGGRRSTTKQFLRHRGRSGYFFWHAVRDKRSFIIEEYSNSIERVLKRLAAGQE